MTNSDVRIIIKKMKVLFVASFLKKHIDLFHLPYIKQIICDGNQLDLMAKNDHLRPDAVQSYFDIGVNKFINVNFSRNLFSISHFFNFLKLKKLIKKYKYDLIITNTPIPSALIRFAIDKTIKTKIIYFAHGFHFYKGSSLLSKIVIYPIEKFLSKKTSLLITLNSEDFNTASNLFKCKVLKVDGVGFKSSFSSEIPKLIYTRKDFSNLKYVSVGELSKRKNHILVLKTLKNISSQKYEYTICGSGKLFSFLNAYVNKYSLNVRLLGFRSDIQKILNDSDVFIFPSKQEGLPVALMEAMALGKLCIVSNVRGNNDLININNGLLFNNSIELSRILINLHDNFNDLFYLRENALIDSKKYSINIVFNKLMGVYREFYNY